MDILKLLTRSTKQTNKFNPVKDGSRTQLPSAGDTINPQLFNDAPGSRGTKRKRGAGKDAAHGIATDADYVDFFATGPGSTNQTKLSVQKASLTPKSKDLVSEPPSELLDEGECRQILRSHRVKVTYLPWRSAQVKRVKKSKHGKSSKKVVPIKEEYKPLHPQPLQSFSELRTTYGIYGRLGDNLVDQGYKIPTEVQMGSLPLLLHPDIALKNAEGELGTSMSEVDLLAIAPTGSGKTLAFLIPIVNKILQKRRVAEDKSQHELEAVVVAPTKELASQIVNEAKKLSVGLGIKVVGMRKGMRVTGSVDDEQEEEEQESEDDSDAETAHRSGAPPPVTKADILITTPGLLLSSLKTGMEEVHTPLLTVRTLVLDEADVLLDSLFREQTLAIWEACTNPELRVTLWSATMGSNIESLASSTIQERRARLHLESESPIVRLVVGLKDSAIPNITHRLTYTATEPGKLLALRQLLHPTAKSVDSTESLRPPFLVFTQTIPRAVALHSELKYDIPSEAGGSSRIAVLHSDLSDASRDQVMTRFRNGDIWVMITTDILSRGVDFRGINGVVNYDVPNSGASYIHRVGRTGRGGRDGGVAVTFYTKEDIPYVKNVANIIAASEKQAGKAPGEASMQKWLLDALPTPSKAEKKRLKLHGVEARRSGVGAGAGAGSKESESDGMKGKSNPRGAEAKGKGKGRMQFSTKSGYERKLENNRRGAIQGSKRRAQQETKTFQTQQPGQEREWGGIDD